jgi:hypothetical protein
MKTNKNKEQGLPPKERWSLLILWKKKVQFFFKFRHSLAHTLRASTWGGCADPWRRLGSGEDVLMWCEDKWVIKAVFCWKEMNLDDQDDYWKVMSRMLTHYKIMKLKLPVWHRGRRQKIYLDSAVHVVFMVYSQFYISSLWDTSIQRPLSLPN